MAFTLKAVGVDNTGYEKPGVPPHRYLRGLVAQVTLLTV
jgi:hypothetical protein